MLSIGTLHMDLDGNIGSPGATNDLALEISAGGDTTVLGFLMEAAQGSALDPAIPQIENGNGNPITPIVAEADRVGGRESLVLAQLGLGEYTVQVGGDHGTFGAFQIDVFLPGDLNQDNVVDDSEYLFATAAVVQSEGNWNAFTARFFRERGIDLTEDLYRRELDADLDGVVDNFDLVQIGKNLNLPAVELTLIGDQDPPTIDAWLADDDGRDPADGIGSDPTIAGAVADASQIVEFQGRFVATPENTYTDLIGLVDSNGNFTLDPAFLSTMPDSPVVAGGGTLEVVDNVYTMEFIGKDEHDNENAVPVEFTFTVISQNDAPVAADDADATDEDTLAAGNVLVNDSDVDIGDTLVVTTFDATSALGAAVTVNANGDFTYNPTGSAALQALPAGGVPVLDTFDYTIEDALGAPATATVTVTVSGVNDAPEAANDTAATDEDTPTAGNILTNDSDIDTGDTLTVTGFDATSTLGAAVTVDANGNFTYDPIVSQTLQELAAGGTPAGDTFTYTIDDGNGGTDTATVTVTVSGVNDVPVAMNDTAATDEDTPTTGNVLTNDSDIDTGDTFTVTSFDATSTLGATVTMDANGDFTYDPIVSQTLQELAAGGTPAGDTFTYTIDDGNGGTDTATVTVTVSGVNDVPVATNDTAVTDEDTPTAGNVLTNDNDIDTGDTFTVTSFDATSTLGAAVTVDAHGNFTYDPIVSQTLQELAIGGAPAGDTFTYTIDDGNGGTDTATVTVTVSGVNDAPVATNDTAATDEDTPIVGNVLGNDSDIDTGDELTVVNVNTAGTLGDLTVDPNTGAFTYDPNGQFEGLGVGEFDTETFEYTIEDKSGAQDTATLTVTVTGVNDAPVAGDDTANTDEDSTVTIDVLANDNDADDNDALSVGAFDATSDGGATISRNGDDLDYDPRGQFDYLAEGEQTTDTFEYTVADGHPGGSDTATVTVTVTGVNDAPVVADQGFTVDPDDPDGVVVDTVAINDPDVGDTHKFVITASNPPQGTVLFEINEDTGVITVPDTDVLVDGTSFDLTVEVTDMGGAGMTDTATITINVVANQPPDAKPDAFTTSEDSPASGNVLNDNGNGADSDPEGDPISVVTTGTDLPADNGGSYSLDAVGNMTYDPGGQFEYLGVGESDTDTFDYTITDTFGGTDSATVTITINGVNDAPTAANDPASTDEDHSVVISVLSNDDDPDVNDVLSINTFDAISAKGALITQNGDNLVYDPNGRFESLAFGESTTDTFQYSAKDDKTGTSSLATVTVTINGVNDAPTAANDPAVTDEDNSVVISVLSNDDDPDVNDVLSINTFDAISAKDALITQNGDNLVYDPNERFESLAFGESTTDTFQYSAKDDKTGTSGPATVTVTINGANDAPTAGNDEANTDKDSTVTIDVLANDTDPDINDTKSVQNVDATSTQGIVTNNGTDVTYDPNGAFDYLTIGESDTDTFSYTMVDGHGASSTATVEVTITGANDAPIVVNPIADIELDDGDSQPAPIDLSNVFHDPNPGDTLTFTIDGSSNINAEMLDVQIVGGTLTVTYFPYSTTQDRTPSTIVVVATDPWSETAWDTFTVTVHPVYTVELALVVRQSATPDTEFTFFTENPTGGGQLGSGRFQLESNSPDSLGYSLINLAGVDLDGAQTPGDTNDDVTGISFRDGSAGGALALDILADDDLIIDAAAGTVTGTWEDAEGFAAFTTQLVNGDLFVNVYTTANPLGIKIAGKNITPSAELVTLPTSLDDVLVGDSYVVEVWVKDTLSTSTGLTNAFVDVNFDQTLSEGSTVGFGNPFDVFAGGGPVDNLNGKVPNLGGSTLFASIGLEPAFARVGYVEFQVTGGGQQTYSLDVNIMDRRAGPDIHAAQINVGAALVNHVAPTTFTIVPGETEVIVSGTVDGIPLVPQQAGVSDRTTITGGTIDVVLDDLNNPTTIQIVQADLDLDVSGQWVPDVNGVAGAADADFGFTMDTIEQTLPATIDVALRDLIVDIWTGDPLAMTDNGGVFSFSSADQVWQLKDPGGGFMDQRIVVDLPGGGQLDVDNSRVDVSGEDLVDDASPLSTYTETATPGTYELRFPSFSRTITFDSNGRTVVLNITGTGVAHHTVGSPLMGTEGDDPAADGTAVAMTLVREPTELDADGQVAQLPESESWIDEWDSYWVELWTNTADGPGVAAGTVDLLYNTQYFTATEIDHGPVFVDDPSGAVDDVAGLVAGIGGSTIRTDAGGDGFALLARVKFQPLPGDQTPVDLLNQSIGPYDLGLQLADAQLEVVDAGTIQAELGKAARTELWAVAYDVNDDDQIDFGDLSYFAASFQQDVLSSDSPYVWALDFDNSGTIDFADFTYLAANFQGQKGAGTDIQFPDSFVQRWVGTTLDLEGETPVDELFDAATEIWQRALGWSEPIDLQLVVRDFGTAQLGEGQILEVDDQGQPIRGQVTIDDDANGLGWYSQLGGSPAEGKYDLYTVFVHEIGHTLGFTQSYAGFRSYVETDADGDKIFVGPDFTAQLDAAARHLDADAHPDDVMNATLAPAVRKLPSVLDVRILEASHNAAANGATGFDSNGAPMHAAFESAPVRSVGLAALFAADAQNALNRLETVGPVTDLALIDLPDIQERPALPEVRQSVRLDHAGLFAHYGSAETPEFVKAPEDQLDWALTDQSDDLEALDAVFEDWEDPLIKAGLPG